MTDKEMVLEDVKYLKKLVFDLIISVVTNYVRSLAISMIIWVLLTFLIADGPNKIGFVALVVTSLISSTILSRTFIKIINHAIHTLRIINKIIPLLEIYQNFCNIPELERIIIDKELDMIDINSNFLINELKNTDKGL